HDSGPERRHVGAEDVEHRLEQPARDPEGSGGRGRETLEEGYGGESADCGRGEGDPQYHEGIPPPAESLGELRWLRRAAGPGESEGAARAGEHEPVQSEGREGIRGGSAGRHATGRHTAGGRPGEIPGAAEGPGAGAVRGADQRDRRG